MRAEKTKILYNSPEAASIQTITGWVSSMGRFWGKDEHMARYEGSTHDICKCGEEKEKGYTICEKCRAAKNIENYYKMPFKEWDGKTPLVLFNDDRYFFDEDEIELYLEDNELHPSDLKLVICEPNHLHEVNPDYWSDITPEDAELPEAVSKALDALNKAISEAKPFSWSEGIYRTEYKRN